MNKRERREKKRSKRFIAGDYQPIEVPDPGHKFWRLMYRKQPGYLETCVSYLYCTSAPYGHSDDPVYQIEKLTFRTRQYYKSEEFGTFAR